MNAEYMIPKYKKILKSSFSRFGKQTFARFSTTAQLKQSDNINKSTVDVENVDILSKLCNKWWDVNGEIKALHAMNPLRIKLIREGLANIGYKEANSARPLEGLKIVDVGCGGGILSEPLARIGAQVTGIDASKELLSIAKQHATLDEDLLSRLTYIHSTIEDFSQEKKNKYDVVIASEIVEHVINQELFLKSCAEVLKPNGSIFITTFNKNYLSWFGGIILAEYVFRTIPKGIHDWNKFIPPEEVSKILEKYNCKTKLVHGTIFNPLINSWRFISSTALHYALHAVKQDAVK